MGVTTGAVLSKNKKKGAISGAIGAVVAETVAEHLPSSSIPVQGIDTALTRPALPQHTEVAKLVATTVATVANLDADIALRTADTAVRYNCILHPSYNAEVEEKRVEALEQGGEKVAEFLGTPIASLEAFQRKRMARALGELEAVNAELAKPNLSFMAKNALYAQRDHLLNYLGNMQVNIPTTVGEVGLTGVAMGSNLGLMVKPFKDGAKALKLLRHGQKLEHISEASQLMKALNLEVGGSQSLANRGSFKNVVDSSNFSQTSKITALERKGRVMFDNVEFRAVRDLSHMSEQDLRYMLETGKNAHDTSGTGLVGHHFQQQYHRNPGSFIVEIPEPKHNISNPVQHPKGNTKGGGLAQEERADWNKLRKAFNKERAKQELIKRGIINEQ